MNNSISRNDGFGREKSCRPGSIPGLLFISFLLIVCCTSLSYAAQPVGKFTAVTGKVDVLKAGAPPAVPAKTGDALAMKDVVRTKSDAMAEITFNDGNILKLSQRTRIDISQYVAEDAKGKRIITMPAGRVEAIVPKTQNSQANRFEIRTPNATAGVRGTQYIVIVTAEYTEVVVTEGEVTVYNPKFPGGVQTVKAGETIKVPKNGPAPSPTKSSSRDLTKKKGGTEKTDQEKKIEADLAAKRPLNAILKDAVDSGMNVEDAVAALIGAGADPKTAVYTAISEGYSAEQTVFGALAAGSNLQTVTDAAVSAGGDRGQIAVGESEAGYNADQVADSLSNSSGPGSPVYGYSNPNPTTTTNSFPQSSVVIGGGGGGGSTNNASPSKPKKK